MKWFLLLLSAVSFAQVPTGLTASMDERTAPELKVHLYWETVSGAQSYNIYQSPATSTGSCNNAITFDANVTSNFYVDDAYPNWWQMPVNSGWRNKFWCYAVSSIVPDSAGNPVESGLSNSVFVTIGNAGYLNVTYFTACSGGRKITPFPYMGNQIEIHLYYVDPNTTKHEIPLISFYNAYPYPPNDPVHSSNEEVEWKIPVVGLDGTVIPWVNGGVYIYTVKTPDGGNYAGKFAPEPPEDASYFNQIMINRTIGGNCPVGYGVGGNYSLWQNVTR